MTQEFVEPSIRGWFELAGLYIFLNYDSSQRETDYISYISTLSHESDHLALMLSTTYGVATYVANVLMTYLVKVCTNRLINHSDTTSGCRIKIPLRRWRTHADGMTRRILDESLLSISLVDIMCQRLATGLGMTPSPEFPKYYGFVKSLVSEWISHLFSPQAELGSPECLAQIRCTVASKDSLGAIDILESHARLAQTIGILGFERELAKHDNTTALKGLLARSKTSFSDEAKLLLRSFVGHYGRAFDVAAQYISLESSDDLAIFSALCDLALMTPFGLCFDVPRDGRKYDWTDLHPGWRFVRSLRFLSESGIHHRTQAVYVDLVEAICKHFSWPTPWDLATTANEGQLLQAWAPLPDLFGNAFDLRLALPEIFASPWRTKADPAQWRDVLLPPVIHLRDWVKLKVEVKDHVKLMLAFYQHDLARQLVTKNRLDDPIVHDDHKLSSMAQNVLSTAFGVSLGTLEPLI